MGDLDIFLQFGEILIIEEYSSPCEYQKMEILNEIDGLDSAEFVFKLNLFGRILGLKLVFGKVAIFIAKQGCFFRAFSVGINIFYRLKLLQGD